MKEDGEIVEYLYELGPTQHHLPITALSCHGETIATAGMDGITQYFQVGELDNSVWIITTIVKRLKPFSFYILVLCERLLIEYETSRKESEPANGCWED